MKITSEIDLRINVVVHSAIHCWKPHDLQHNECDVNLILLYRKVKFKSVFSFARDDLIV